MPPEWDDKAKDDELVRACLGGDQSAWATLIRRYRRLIYTIPLRFGMSPAAAEEVFQEVCLTLLQNLHTVRDQTRLSAWLATVTRRICIEYWRRTPGGGQEDFTDEVDERNSDLEAELIVVERWHVMMQAMRMLDERCQHLLQALFLNPDPPSYQQLAQELGMAEGSIGPTRARCLEKLRKFMVKIEAE